LVGATRKEGQEGLGQEDKGQGAMSFKANLLLEQSTCYLWLESIRWGGWSRQKEAEGTQKRPYPNQKWEPAFKPIKNKKRSK